MPDDAAFIELIDVDPDAFGPSAAGAAPPPPERHVPWRAIVVAAGVVAVLGLVVAGLLAWKPWEHDPTLRLADPRPDAWTLSERLVFAPPPARPRTALLGTATTARASAWKNGSVGYFFGDPDATFDPKDGKDRWFGFTARPSSDPDTPMVLGQQRISGVPAEVSDETGGDLVQLAWGPLDGWTFNAAASQMTTDQALAVAEQLRIVDGRPVMLDRAALDGMQPLGPFGDYIALATITTYAQNVGKAMRDLNAVYYGFGGQALVSMPGNESAIDFAGFVLAVDGSQERTVHGRRAIGFTKGAGPFGSIDRSTVLWWEGGRIVLVAGDGDLDATFDLAETAHEANADEWATVEALD